MTWLAMFRKAFWKKVGWILGRGLLFCVLLAVALAAFAAISLKVVFTPERIRFLLVDQLETALKRPVVMDSVSINPLGGVRVDGFRVLRRDKPWAEPLVESETFIANFQIWPLVAERRLVLDEIWLTRPKIQLIRRADGTFNYSDLFQSTAAAKAPAAPAGPVALSIAQAQLVNGRFVFTDETDGSRHELSQIQCRVSDFRIDGPFRFSLSFSSEHRATSDPLPSATVDLDGRLDLAGLDLSRAQLDIQDLSVRTAAWRFSARGYAADLTHPRGALDADISPASAGARLSVKKLRGLVLAPLNAQASFSMPDLHTLQVKAFQVSDRSSRLEGDGQVTLAGSSTTWRLHLKSAGLDLADAAQYLPSLSRYALGGRLEFETTVSSGPAGLQVGRTQVMVQGLSASFGEHRIHSADISFASPPEMKVARLQVSGVKALYFGQDLSELSFDAEIHGPDWTFHSLKGVWNRMRWALRGKVTEFFRPKRLEIYGGADVIYIQEIVNLAQRIIEYHRRRAAEAGREPAKEGKWFEAVKYGVPKTFPALAGRLGARRVVYDYLTGADFAIKFDVQGMEPGMKSLTGYAQYAMGPGSIKNTTAMMQNSKFLRVIFLPFLTLDRISTMGMLKGFQARNELGYKRIVGDYKATWGNVRVNELVIDTEDILLSGNGQIDLPAESIQLYVLNRLYKTKGTLPETLTCDDGKPCLAFFVEGDLGVPDARLDLNKIRTQKGADVLNQRLKQFQILKTIIPTE